MRSSRRRAPANGTPPAGAALWTSWRRSSTKETAAHGRLEDRDEALPTRGPGVSGADLRARVRLAPGVVRVVLRSVGRLPPGHHHSVRLSVNADSGGDLRMGIREGLRG